MYTATTDSAVPSRNGIRQPHAEAASVPSARFTAQAAAEPAKTDGRLFGYDKTSVGSGTDAVRFGEVVILSVLGTAMVLCVAVTVAYACAFALSTRW